MTWANKDKCAIVGIGATDYYVRGKSWPRSIYDLAGEAILKACDDAGLSVQQIDGFAYYAGATAGYVDKFDTGSFMETLGMPQVSFTAALTSGGGGSAGAIGLAVAGLTNEDCKYAVTVTVMACQQTERARLGASFGTMKPDPESSFLQPSGLAGPGHLVSVLARRHMHLYGTTREALGEVVMASRSYSQNRAKAIRKSPLSMLEYEESVVLADPLRRLDFCLETDGAVAVITTTAQRAVDCRHPPVLVHACAHGASREWRRSGEHPRRASQRNLYHRHDSHRRSGRAGPGRGDQPGPGLRTRPGDGRPCADPGFQPDREEGLMRQALKHGPARLLPGEQITIATSPDTEPFWQAAKQHRLTACQCAACGHFRMPPTAFCPNCSSRDKAWPTLSGTGTVFSYAICTRNPLTGEDFVYVPVVVDLDGAPGTRLIGNLTGCGAEDVRIGMPVSVEWTEIRDGWVLPNFRAG